ncbi:MAG: hypothetical protein Q9225_005077 [Loekoesia sp. 1 TL-2023]
MLAAVDNDSDPDVSIRSNGGQPLSVQTQGRGSGSPKSDYSSCEDASNGLRAPRGRVAARLRAQAALNHASSGSDDNNVGHGYSQIKKRLAGHSTNSPLGKEKSPSTTETPSSTDEDDILPAVTRRMKKTPNVASAGSQSPEASIQASQRSSPGLFLTPRKEQKPCSSTASVNSDQHSGSESDMPADPEANNRFLALVARKREERKAKAKAEAEEKARRFAESRKQRQDSKNSNVDLSGVSEDDSDVAGGEILTQQARPTRKASKRALEEMNRETQRMSRNMQLAHQARTKKKITKESFFERFNFRNKFSAQPDTAAANSSSATASSNPVSDIEARHSLESPPTSPVTPGDEILKINQSDQNQTQPMDCRVKGQRTLAEEDLPDVQFIVAQSQERRDEGAAQAIRAQSERDSTNVQEEGGKEKISTKKQIRVRLPKPNPKHNPGQQSDSDLEVLPVNKTRRKLDVFNRLPAAKVSEGRSLQKLRALAHLTSPDKRANGLESGLSLMDLQRSLQKRARQQAARERAEKIQELKDRGVIIQTAEERQKDQAEVEDLLEKARREAVELKQKEKDIAKKQAKANGEPEIADDSSDEDGDYQENDADESEVDLSGSEEEGESKLEAGQDESDEEDPEDDKYHEGGVSERDGNLIENEAYEASGEDEQDGEAHDDDEDSDTEEQQLKQAAVRRRKHKVVDDDEDEGMQEDRTEKVASVQVDTPLIPNLGLPTIAAAPMGMTQAFAATMADSQTQADSQRGLVDREEDSLAFLGAPPEPEFPVYEMDDSPQMILDSQQADGSNSRSQDEIQLDFSQSAIRETPMAETVVESTATQLSEIPDPTQDVGFALTSPVAGRYAFIPPSTMDTVILSQPDGHETPAVKKRGRLTRKTDITVAEESDASADAGQAGNETIISANAFDVLKKGPKKPSGATATFDKKRSNAHEMVEEQAQESEDEYAGLGGASDDESGGEEDEEVKKMIEQGEVDVDERELAAFYAWVFRF